MTTVTLEEVRSEVGSQISTSLNSALDAIDWKSKLNLPAEPVAPMSQDPPALPPAFSNLGRWIQDRGDKPLAEGELIRFEGDQIEVVPPGEYAPMAQDGVAGIVTQLDNATPWDIPLGAVVFGAIPGAITGEVIDGLVPLRTADDKLNMMNPALKGAAIAAAVMFGERLIGRRASQFYAGALVLQMFVDVFPLDRFVNWAVRQLRRDDDGQVAQAVTAPTRQGDVPIREVSGGNRVLDALFAA